MLIKSLISEDLKQSLRALTSDSLSAEKKYPLSQNPDPAFKQFALLLFINQLCFGKI